MWLFILNILEAVNEVCNSESNFFHETIKYLFTIVLLWYCFISKKFVLRFDPWFYKIKFFAIIIGRNCLLKIVQIKIVYRLDKKLDLLWKTEKWWTSVTFQLFVVLQFEGLKAGRSKYKGRKLFRELVGEYFLVLQSSLKHNCEISLATF